MFNIKLAGDYLYGKLLFTWLSLVMSLVLSFCVVVFYQKMFSMRSGAELNQFFGLFLTTLLLLALKRVS